MYIGAGSKHSNLCCGCCLMGSPGKMAGTSRSVKSLKPFPIIERIEGDENFRPCCVWLSYSYTGLGLWVLLDVLLCLLLFSVQDVQRVSQDCTTISLTPLSKHHEAWVQQVLFVVLKRQLLHQHLLHHTRADRTRRHKAGQSSTAKTALCQ